MLTSCECEKPRNLSSPQEDMSTRPRCSINSFLPGLNLQTGLPTTLPWDIFSARSRCHHRWLWSRFVTSTPARRSLAHLQPETGKIYMWIVYQTNQVQIMTIKTGTWVALNNLALKFWRIETWSLKIGRAFAVPNLGQPFTIHRDRTPCFALFLLQNWKSEIQKTSKDPEYSKPIPV